jgi:hypothetical protein
MTDKRLKKNALFELLQDLDMRSTGGPLIAAGTKGKVLVKHRKDQSTTATQQKPNMLWVSLADGKHYYHLQNDDALLRYIGIDPDFTPIQRLMNKCQEYGISQEDLAAAIRAEAGLRAEKAIQEGLQSQLAFLAQAQNPEISSNQIAEVDKLLQALNPNKFMPVS